MEICNKARLIFKLFVLLFVIFFTNQVHSEINIRDLEKKKVSYFDFFLLKFENKLFSRAQILGKQAIITRVQYSNIGTQVNYDKKKGKIFIQIYAIMDKYRYSKKKYKQKLTDCNQVRNLIFYRKYGYSLFRQKRDPNLSEDLMKEIFKEVFFKNIDFNDKEINFILEKMFITVTIFHPINKTELICSGKVNDYELQ